MNSEIKKTKKLNLKNIYVFNEVTGDKVKPGLVVFDPDTDEITFMRVKQVYNKNVVII